MVIKVESFNADTHFGHYGWQVVGWGHMAELKDGQVSISSTIYECIFCQYFGAKNNKTEMFGFVIFWCQNIFEKAVRVKCLWNRGRGNKLVIKADKIE